MSNELTAEEAREYVNGLQVQYDLCTDERECHRIADEIQRMCLKFAAEWYR